MSIDPLSLVIGISALLLGIWNHVKSSKCGSCEIQMDTHHKGVNEIVSEPNIQIPALVKISEPIPIPTRIPVFTRKNIL